MVGEGNKKAYEKRDVDGRRQGEDKAVGEAVAGQPGHTLPAGANRSIGKISRVKGIVYLCSLIKVQCYWEINHLGVGLAIHIERWPHRCTYELGSVLLRSSISLQR